MNSHNSITLLWLVPLIKFFLVRPFVCNDVNTLLSQGSILIIEFVLSVINRFRIATSAVACKHSRFGAMKKIKLKYIYFERLLVNLSLSIFWLYVFASLTQERQF